MVQLDRNNPHQHDHLLAGFNPGVVRAAEVDSAAVAGSRRAGAAVVVGKPDYRLEARPVSFGPLQPRCRITSFHDVPCLVYLQCFRCENCGGGRSPSG